MALCDDHEQLHTEWQNYDHYLEAVALHSLVRVEEEPNAVPWGDDRDRQLFPTHFLTSHPL